MPEHDILGIEVSFPYTPYPSQLVYMERVIEALRNGSNALLESPTGTGKTLCLLCATLGWLRAYTAALQARGQGLEARALAQKAGAPEPGARAGIGDAVVAAFGGAGAGKEVRAEARPRVVYASRTHAQLAQVVRELKKTSYRPKLSVLGSREQLCVHDEVSTLRGGAQVAACRSAVAHRECSAKVQGDRMMQEMVHIVHGEPRDIEEVGNVVREAGCCPFFVARESAADAELVLMPYNYVLDAGTREAMAIDPVNDVLILDEGHNLLDACANEWSFDLTPVLLRGCANTLNTAANLSDKKSRKSVAGADANATESAAFRELAVKLETVRARMSSLPQPAEDAKEPRVVPPSALLGLLADVDIDIASYPTIKRILDDAVAEVVTDKTTSQMPITGVRVVTNALRVLIGHGRDRQRVEEDFVVVVQPKENPSLKEGMSRAATTTVKRKTTSWYARKAPARSSDENEEDTDAAGHPVVSVWCMNPGLAMCELKNAGLRSVLLTSGTLSPLDAFAREMRIPFDVTLENSHVIGNGQIDVCVMAKGPMGTKLNSSFKNRESENYKKDIGRALVNLSRVTPDGLLVFFPSYSVLRGSLECWKSCPQGQPSIWDQLQRSKRILVESQDSSFLQDLLKTHEANVRKKVGSCLLAVCRGRISEGIDFADANGRAVVVTGLPYASAMDPRVKLKKQYMDKHRSELRMSGAEWYSIQAIRAVNQAVGRIIRHRNDYGAVILADERFAEARHSNTVSRWLRPHIRKCQTYGEAHAQLSRFFRVAATAPFAQASPCTVSEQTARDPAIHDAAREHVRHLLPQKRGHRESFVLPAPSVSKVAKAPSATKQSVAQFMSNVKERVGKEKYTAFCDQLRAMKRLGPGWSGTAEEKTELQAICVALRQAFGGLMDPLLVELARFVPSAMATDYRCWISRDSSSSLSQSFPPKRSSPT